MKGNKMKKITAVFIFFICIVSQGGAVDYSFLGLGLSFGHRSWNTPLFSFTLGARSQWFSFELEAESLGFTGGANLEVKGYPFYAFFIPDKTAVEPSPTDSPGGGKKGRKKQNDNDPFSTLLGGIGENLFGSFDTSLFYAGETPFISLNLGGGMDIRLTERDMITLNVCYVVTEYLLLDEDILNSSFLKENRPEGRINFSLSYKILFFRPRK